MQVYSFIKYAQLPWTDTGTTSDVDSFVLTANGTINWEDAFSLVRNLYVLEYHAFDQKGVFPMKFWSALQGLADKALAAFIIIQAALKRSERLAVFSRRDDLNKRMPNFQVCLGTHPQLDIENYRASFRDCPPTITLPSDLNATKLCAIELDSKVITLATPFLNVHTTLQHNNIYLHTEICLIRRLFGL